MSSSSDSDDNDEFRTWARRIKLAGQAYKQSRFRRIPDTHLNQQTVAGIRDMNLGRVRNGQPVGAPTIRFNTGHTSGANPHITIDPRGRPNANNPRIEVPPGVVRGATTINTTLKYAGVTLAAASVVIDTWRIASAFKEDLEIKKNAYKIIRDLEDAIDKLKAKLENESSASRRRDLRDTIDHLKRVLKDVKRTEKVPVKFLKATSSVAGGWGGGMAGGSAGAWGGAQAGALIGAPFGPVGVALGAPLGAIAGGMAGGIGGGYLGSTTAETVTDWGLQLADSDSDSDSD